MVEILETLERTDPVKNLWGLVRKVAVCTVIDFNRRQQAEKRVIAGALPGNMDLGPAATTDNPGSRSDQTDVIEARDQFLYIFQRLETTCQEIIKGLFIQGLGYADLAVSMGVTEGSLRIRLMRCREKARQLRDQLDTRLSGGNRPHA
jgi:RNA polymerase sigma factor (sigma-70 family)